MKPQDKKNHRIGHRKRLRSKFATGSGHMFDYELIELLLFYVFRQKDTRPLAKNLLNYFKSLRKLIFADNTDLNRVNGIGESTVALIFLIREILNRVLAEKFIDPASIISTTHVIEYYKNTIGYLKKEQLRIMFLNNRNKLISEELMQEGTTNNTAIYPKEIIQKALNYGASAIIMVHNHPSGDPKPSRQDIIMTKAIKEIALKLDIILLDHIIVGKSDVLSLKELGIV